MRLFVAAYPPPEVRDDLAALVRALAVGQLRAPGRSVRLAPPEQWHITLAFLGEVPEPKVDRAKLAVQRAVEAVGAAPAVRIAGGGTFGRGRFTTLWAGLRGDTDTLASLARATRRELKAARLPYDAKRFRPHMTIARPGDRVTADELAGDLAALERHEGPLWTVSSTRLVRSHLGPRPTYEPLAEVALTP